jgi:murein L,D-transpeptidase YcbB/YkuD
MNSLSALLPLLLLACASPSAPPKAAGPAPAAVDSVPFASAEDVVGRPVDSAAVAAYLQHWNGDADDATAFMEFYRRRAFSGAWVDASGHLTASAETFLSMAAESDSLLRGMSVERDTLVERFVQQGATGGPVAFADPQGTELDLTAAFFRYADRNYRGGGAQRTRQLDWFIPVHKKDMSELLEALCSDSADITAHEPVHPQYNRLKQQLKRYQAIEARGGWKPITAEAKGVHKGDRGGVIPEVRARLATTGDITYDDRSDAFDTELDKGIKRFQQRYGMDTTGLIDDKLIREMNRPVRDRVHQIMLNMERLRWLDGNAPPDYLLVNIPEYKLHVFENGKHAWDMVVVVGKEATRPTIFRGDLSTVVLAPYWYVPQSIVDQSVKPGMRKDPNYLNRMHMEVVSQKPFAVRQKPGEFNSLGLAKFLFANSYSIYMHDTPSKNLFDRSERAFSHGCVRLKEPAKLAGYLLRDQPQWTPEAIDKAMHGGSEKAIRVTKPIPVVILYLTAWVDEQGLINFRDDVYGRDAKLAKELFVD